jgi:predicted MPP superfamily phosphohydrolase
MRRLLFLLLAAVVAFFGFGLHAAWRDPVVARYRLNVAGLQRPLRIVQLSDSHVGSPVMPAARLEGVVGTINALRPDLVVLTGDYVGGPRVDTTAALAPFARLQAPMGVLAVLGNNDDRAPTSAGMASAGVRLLVGDRVDLPLLSVVGAASMTGGSPAVEAMRRAVRRSPAGKPLLVIVHEPSFFRFLPPRPAIMIAGHTHGGQVRLPIIGSWSPDPYIAHYPRGVFERGAHRLVVSSGLGTSILPIRIGVPPEIVELTLVPA